MAQKIFICGIDTSTLPKYSAQEMCEMLLLIKQGDLQEKQRFIFGNLRLVLSIIHSFNNKNVNADDLFQVGCIGLIKAIDNFDISLNLKFSTYAVPMIIGEIKRFVRDNSSLRVARSLRDMAYKALQAREQLTKKNNVEPTIEEIAKLIQCPYKDVVCALDAISDPISLFDPISHDENDGIAIMDQVADAKNGNESWSINFAVKEAVKNLPKRERDVLIMRYYMGKTQIEISNEVGISQAQVSRLEKNALQEISKTL